MTTKELADKIQNILLATGFIIQRYDATTSNSVYLKLDYGVAMSIRISDHPGKSKLKYRYNIGSHIKHKKTGTHDMRFYPESAINSLIKDICDYRDHKINDYGKEAYQKFMIDNQATHMHRHGFWRTAKLIQA